MSRFAKDTDVPVDRTRLELEQLLQAYKARATAVFNSPDHAAIAFEMHERRVLFKLRMPSPTDQEFTYSKVNQSRTKHRVSEGVARKRYDQACRRKWRALLLAIRAKLVAVDEGIETFEDAFLAHVVMPDGSTVGETIRPRIAAAYKDGKMQPLLPGPTPPP